ncbi:unnamed protein product [Cladocopium goreaui]|uniref:Uncharacterized protein n=1 Tax=Cladocopium goreaui TaxID=2562237 RepID=A0A9P1BLR2_9DINO|nr:unnamed protein product [Cladocopium goreaui]
MSEFSARSEKRRRVQTLLPVFQELEDLAHTGAQLCKRSRDLQRAAPVNLEEICHFASQLRMGVPAKLPLDAKSLPLAPLPAGFWLPFPTLEEEIPNATALATGLRRCPPPHVSLQPSQTSGAAWAVQLRALPPATSVLFTVDGSVPRLGSKSTMQATQAPVLLAEGAQVCAVAAAAGKHLSDVITVKTPNAKVAAPSEPAKVAPKKATSKSSFRNDLLLADSDDD